MKRALAALLLIATLAGAAVAVGQVTIEGEVTQTFAPAGDGSSTQYELSDLDAADNFTIDAEGVVSEEWDNESASGVSPSGGSSISVGGDLDPVGPGGGDPVIEVTADALGFEYNPYHANGGSHTTEMTFVGESSDDAYKSGLQVQPDESGKVQEIAFGVVDGVGDVSTQRADIYISEGGFDQTYEEGTLVKSDWQPETGSGYLNVSLDSAYPVESGNTYTVEVVTIPDDDDTSSGTSEIRYDNSAGSTWMGYDHGGNKGEPDAYPDVSLGIQRDVGPLSVGSDSGASASLGTLSDGETASSTLDLASTDSTLSFSTETGGSIDYSLAMKERTETPPFGVEINGEWANSTFGLTDGESSSLTTDTAWLREGTNRINVSVDTSGLSSDAPAPKVNLDYRHDAAGEISTTYSSEHWTERYNASKTFATERDNATLTIPFNSKVYDIRDLQMRTNGADWSDVADYSLDDTTLTADVGDIEAGDDVTIRTNGSKARVHNGSIEVLEPTMTGSALDSKIQINDWQDGAYIGVPEIGSWNEVHYIYNESWSASPSVWQAADGEQRLRLPEAGIGSTTRVSTIPLEANPQTGDVVMEVEEASSTEPVVRVRPGDDPGDDVEFTHIDASDGTEYILWSYTKEIIRDQGTASSPLTLEDDDSEETLGILIDSENATSPPGDGDSGGVSLMGHEVREPRTPGETLLVAGLMLTVVIGAYLSTRRRDLPRKGIEAIPTRFLASRSVQIGLAVIAAVLAIRFNFIAVPAGMTAIIGIVGAVAGSYFLLRRFEMFSMPVFAAISTIAAVLGVELISPGTIGTLIGGEGVQRAIPFVLIAGVYLAYQGVQTWREGNTTEVVIGDEGSN